MKDMIHERLLSLADAEYKAFMTKLLPTVDSQSVIGVRLPLLRALAKELCKSGEANAFMDSLPHRLYEENMLHALLICDIREYSECVGRIDEFLPFVDNWGTCDSMRPKCFVKNRDRLISDIERWISSEHVYTKRFGLEMLMTHYLDGDFECEMLDMAASVKGEDYYLQMMVAWYFATALAKQYDSAVPYIEQQRLSPWVHAKTIQKALESARIPQEKKEYLRSLRCK